MFKNTILTGLIALGLGAGAALAAGGERHVTDFKFSFEGPFGKYDQSQLQRGLQVYTEVCAGCHGLQYVSFRSLHEEGGPALEEDAMRAYAAAFEVFDPELDDYRPAAPTDYFPVSAIENAPDLSLMAKARAGFHGPAGLGINQIIHGMGGPEYITSLLLGFSGEEVEEAGTLLYENDAFGGNMAMSPVLYGDDVEYADGTEASAEQEAMDVSAFLMWAAEPKMMARKQAGLTAVLFLTVLTVLLYFTNKKLWRPHKGSKHS